MGKSGDLTPEEQKAYDIIQENIPRQRENYAAYLETLSSMTKETLLTKSAALGFHVELETGALRYRDDFKPLSLAFELCYVRHGRTEGNTEPRIYQGQVDYEDNQLNPIGRQQAEDAAKKMDDLFEQWQPNLLVFSPLERAIETGQAFATRHPEIQTVILPSSAEMAFGIWDDQRVIDVDPTSYGHLFYIDQNAVISAAEPHRVKEGWYKTRRHPGELIPPESFIDLLERMIRALHEIDALPEVEAIRRSGHTAKVVMYGHSMAGAAVSMLLGHGRCRAGSKNLGFDGKYVMPNATPTMLVPQQPTTTA